MTKTAISLSVHRLESIFRIEITTNQQINHQSTVNAPHILPRMTPTRIVHCFARRRVVDIARASFSSSSTDRRHGRAFADTMTSPRIVRGVVFDMDGTLCASAALDFAEMRRRTGCVTSDILGEVDSWEDARRRRAYDVIEEMEREALAMTTALPGAADAARALDEMGVPRALVTRNAATSVDYFHERVWTRAPFSPRLSREFTPYKPAPDAILHICETWGCAPSEVIMVGDSAKDDVVSGNRAGAVTVLLDSGRTEKWVEEFGVEDVPEEMVPHFVVADMHELRALLTESGHFEFRSN